MAIRVAIHHKTEYQFDRLTTLFPHVLRLRPAPHSRTKIHSYSLKVTPEDHFLNWQQDPFGNFQARLVFPEQTKSLAIEVEVIADMTSINPFDFFVEDYAETIPFSYAEQLQRELIPYLEVTEAGPLLSARVAAIKAEIAQREKQDKPWHVNDFLVQINQQLQQDIGYGVRLEPGIQSCEETLTLAKGSCRDSAWLLVQIFRHLGYAARFASGYLVQLTSDIKALDGPSGPEKDFTDLHAWTEVFIPGAGWVGLDPTSGLLATEGHIPLACTPDPISAAPITGATSKCEVEFAYSNEVFRILEDPRVTKPYTEDQWQTINALGAAVDKELLEQDVRLTTGGEPTFVSIDDMESEQWNTGALGADKLRLAKDLLLRMRNTFAPNGLLHYGQGKWYPGEEVPRWALGCFWRTDGEALWSNPDLLARADKSYGLTHLDAKKFAQTLCEKIRVNSEHLIPAYEDVLYYLWAEQQLPANIDPLTADLKDDLERRRIAKLLTRGLNTESGYVLPIEWNYLNQSWLSGRWKLRNDNLFLIPGDSPLGLRLPLNSLEFSQHNYERYQPESDPLRSRAPLAASGQQFANLAAQKITAQPIGKNDSENSTEKNTEKNTAQKNKANYVEAGYVIRTAMCFEARDGRLHLFLPPLTYLEHYVALIEAIEDTAATLNMPVVLEGYEPPKDYRLKKFLITPDPGVIEVNIHPVETWADLVNNTEALYEDARQCRLGTEKFMLDGRHSGTGGGNHVTFGGSTPANSPFLRRPDLLRSLVTFWQHHPGLSYLFSGLFIGPTSQSPRVDEGRAEMLYELEIAFQQMPDGIVEQPWLVDRLMRNLLIDITGNTHRAEFCIDKLYSPGSASGRQGILEFRGFEMPPHARMSLVQVLLLRCLISRFWKEPYKKPLVRWGTALHDKFMLPHYVWEDLRDVVNDLNEHGYPFQLEWLAPFEEFRFPHYGRVQLDDIQIELRWAIEPWHVLGEEVSSFGTSRYVDSSLERLQVKVTGLTPGRYVLACNGRRVCLNPTGKHGEFVGGVRYRAWQPPSALHPTIGIHAPLVFDLIDTWNGKSIGGCTYHVSHPGGRSYERFPVNANEAESRRGNRFFDINYTPGALPITPAGKILREFFEHKHPPRPMAPPPEEPADEYPHTLDLRK
ncbi:Transglutaminase-like superfamily domain protein [Cellvibrio sp. BR]|uniref:transglutaminase family protein n=1 Tax=Cellvibrio sp. BR TaxID=1134474 RepID=UPI00026017B5|nr:transglutaminase family protein [Cellvibrio sp. BR]EIK44151.1 Transglutaminase-like superfamily domain protein [Cellvibrio sp. BR]